MNRKTFLWCALGLAFMAFLFCYYSFITAKCLSYPWWYEQGSDGDGQYVTQTLTLLNNGSLTFVFHPGATVFAIHGFFYHLLSFLPGFHAFTQLSQMPNPGVVFDMLDVAMRTSRILTVVLNVVCMGLFWRLLYQLTRSLTLSYLLAAFFMTTRFMLWERVFIIRPELISFMFLLLVFSMVLDLRCKTSPLVSGGLIGLFAGLACFAKIQVLPEILCLVLLWLCAQEGWFKDNARAAGMGLVLAVVNLIVMPWFWLKRPAMVTDAYLQEHFNPMREELRLYGSLPATVAPVFVVILGALFIAAMVVFFKYRNGNRAGQVIFKLSALATGLIAACYVVFYPIGMDFGAYFAASNHLLYVTVTSLMSGGTLNHKVIDADTIPRIFGLHNESAVLGLPFLRCVIVAAIASGIRILWPSRVNKRPYAAVFLFFIIGFVMDVFSSFRQYTPGGVIVSSYAIYSLSAYVCGVGLWLAAERLHRLASVFLCLHLIGFTVYTLRTPPFTLRPQEPKQEMMNTYSSVWGFWDMASQGKLK